MLDWFANRWNDLVDVFYSIVLSFFDMLKDVFCFFLESMLSIVHFALNGLGSMLGALDIVQYLSILPPEVQNVMALAGVNDASSIIVAAIGIRILLQLIPFTRLGS